MSALLGLMRKEVFHIRRDRRTLAVILLMPFVQVLLFGYAIRTDVRHVRLAIVDPEPGPETLALRARFEGAGLFDIDGVSKRMVDLMAMGTHHALILFMDQYLTLAGLVHGGVFERHPELKVLVLECGGGWIAHWMDRFDEFLEAYDWALPAPLSLTPSEYFRRNCVISFDPGERTMGAMAELAGADNLIWASDFPHSDAKYPGVVDELIEHVEHLPDDVQRKVLGANAARIYGIEHLYDQRVVRA